MSKDSEAASSQSDKMTEDAIREFDKFLSENYNSPKYIWTWRHGWQSKEQFRTDELFRAMGGTSFGL